MELFVKVHNGRESRAIQSVQARQQLTKVVLNHSGNIQQKGDRQTFLLISRFLDG
jgi:hypothetical protein